MFKGQTMKSFEQLTQEFNLPNHDFYKFLQLRHYLQKHEEWEIICKLPSKLEELLMSFTKEKTKKGAISNIYKALQHDSDDSNMKVKEKWELESNIIITDEEWEETFKAGHKLTNSPSWREFDWKVKMRYFDTPIITSNYSNTSKLCWRGCGLVGDFTHIFWDCPKLIDFWKNVQKEIKLILGVNFTLDPALVILGILPDTLDRDLVSLMRILLLVAKKMITVNWLRPQPPNIVQWRERLKNVYMMEKITARLHLKMDLFAERWSPLIQAMSNS